MRHLLALSIILILSSCNCDDCGDSKKYAIVISNLSSNIATLTATGLSVTINVGDEYRLEGTSAADEPAPSSLQYENITFTFNDGKILTYSADVSVIINGKERNPLTSRSYEYKLVNGVPTYYYSIIQEDYDRAI
jgi:hypothetical protein